MSARHIFAFIVIIHPYAMQIIIIIDEKKNEGIKTMLQIKMDIYDNNLSAIKVFGHIFIDLWAGRAEA